MKYEYKVAPLRKAGAVIHIHHCFYLRCVASVQCGECVISVGIGVGKVQEGRVALCDVELYIVRTGYEPRWH